MTSKPCKFAKTITAPYKWNPTLCNNPEKDCYWQYEVHSEPGAYFCASKFLGYHKKGEADAE